MKRLAKLTSLAVAALLLTPVPEFAWGADGTLPPSWRGGPKPSKTRRHVDDGSAQSEYVDESDTAPWYVPEVALGVGLNLPEILPFEGYLFFGKYFALRAFYTPPLPFNIRVEMPSDVISTKKGVGVANPDFEIRLKAIYGPHYGLEALGFPTGGSFFVMAGVSHRQMRLTGSAKSPILVCSLIEAAKDPPCGDPNASIETRTQLELKADIETEALLTRVGFGWFWHVGSSAYFMFNAGASKPSRIHRRVDVEASLDTPSSADEDLTGALATVKSEKEADLESKAVKEMQPVDEKVLPIIGLAAGFRF